MLTRYYFPLFDYIQNYVKPKFNNFDIYHIIEINNHIIEIVLINSIFLTEILLG